MERQQCLAQNLVGRTALQNSFDRRVRSRVGRRVQAATVPQKLPVALLAAALGNTTEMNLDTGIVDEGGEEFGIK